jgi:hypothetical protein
MIQNVLGDVDVDVDGGVSSFERAVFFVRRWLSALRLLPRQAHALGLGSEDPFPPHLLLGLGDGEEGAGRSPSVPASSPPISAPEVRPLLVTSVRRRLIGDTSTSKLVSPGNRKED